MSEADGAGVQCVREHKPKEWRTGDPLHGGNGTALGLCPKLEKAPALGALQREHDREEEGHSTQVGKSPRGPEVWSHMMNMAIIILWCNDA